MRSVSNAFHEAVSARCRRISHSRITIGSTVLTGDNVRKTTFSDAVCDSDVMMPGSVCSAQVQLNVKYQAGIDYVGQRVVVERGVELADGTVEYVKIGTFWVTDPYSSDDYKTVDLTCQDAIVKFGGTYEPKVSFPAALSAVFQDVVDQAGATMAADIVFPDIELPTAPQGYTNREMLGYLAGMCGKFAKATRDGEITMGWFNPTGETIQTDNIAMGGFRRLNGSPIRSRFSVYTDLGETIAVPDVPDDEEANDTNSDSWLANYQDPREVTGLPRWAIIDDYMYAFSADVVIVKEGEYFPSVIARASVVKRSTYSKSAHCYPVGWGEFVDYSTDSAPGVSIKNATISAANFSISSEDGTYAFTYTKGAAWIGTKFKVPTSSDPSAPADRYAWKVYPYFDYECPFDSFDPESDDCYADDLLSMKPVQMSALAKNWILVKRSGQYDTTSNVELLDGSAEITATTLIYADEFWGLTSGLSSANEADVDISVAVQASFPRYYFRRVAPRSNPDASERDYVWQLFKVQTSYNAGTGRVADNYNIKASYLTPSGGVTATMYLSGENAGFFFKTDILASSCDISYTWMDDKLYAVEVPSKMFFRKTLNENLHLCGTEIIPDDEGGGTEPDPGPGTEIKYDSGAMDYTNPLITADMLNTIQSLMPVTEYMPCSVKWRGNPSYECGDLVTVIDRYGNKWPVPIMRQTMTFQGGMSATIEAPGLTEEAAKFSQSSTTDRSIRRVRADLKRQQATS